MLGNLIILVVMAAVAGAFSLVLLNVLWRGQSRAHWGREAAIARSHQLERRVFRVGIIVVLAMVAAWVGVQLTRQPSCVGKIVIVRGPDGQPLECVCEAGRRGACFDPGP